MLCYSSDQSLQQERLKEKRSETSKGNSKTPAVEMKVVCFQLIDGPGSVSTEWRGMIVHLEVSSR